VENLRLSLSGIRANFHTAPVFRDGKPVTPGSRDRKNNQHVTSRQQCFSFKLCSSLKRKVPAMVMRTGKTGLKAASGLQDVLVFPGNKGYEQDY